MIRDGERLARVDRTIADKGCTISPARETLARMSACLRGKGIEGDGALCKFACSAAQHAGSARERARSGRGIGRRRKQRSPDWRAAAGIVTLLGAQACLAVIDFDAESPERNTAYTYSQEYLRVSAEVPDGFYPIGDPDGTALLTKATIDDARILTYDGEIWVRYDVGEHLSFRGEAPRLFPKLPNDEGDLFPAGLRAVNEGSFVEDGYLVFVYEPPDQYRPLPGTASLEINLGNSLATTGRGVGELRVRGFADYGDAVAGTRAAVDKSVTVADVAPSLEVVPRATVRRLGADSRFTQFEVDSPTPVGGFEVRIDATHRQPDGRLVGAALEDFNVDVDASRTVFASDGGFGFAPADGGWTLRRLAPAGGRCGTAVDAEAGDAERVVRFVNDADYPDGPATSDVALGQWHLCATVPEDNSVPILEGAVIMEVALVPADPAAPFPPLSTADVQIGRIVHQGTTVHIPYVTTDEGYTQRLVIVNRNAWDVAYMLSVRHGRAGRADPLVVEGIATGGRVTTVKLAEVVTLEDPTWGSATLTVASNPAKVDVAVVLVNKVDQSTDTVVLH